MGKALNILLAAATLYYFVNFVLWIAILLGFGVFMLYASTRGGDIRRRLAWVEKFGAIDKFYDAKSEIVVEGLKDFEGEVQPKHAWRRVLTRERTITAEDERWIRWHIENNRDPSWSYD